ncbi:MAG: MgtC/SapB family protein [Candidatus Competibacteraceae bacterium]
MPDFSLPDLVKDWAAQVAILVEVAIAMALGGLIGFEREMADRPAGLRTHLLVAGAAALMVGLGDSLLSSFLSHRSHEMIRSDPIRVIQAIVIGIGFLGTGTIFRDGNGHVEGLTTAASLLLTAGIGISVAMRQFILALGVTMFTVLVLHTLKWLEQRLKRKHTGQ